MLVNNEFQTMWKETVVAQFEGNKENYGNSVLIPDLRAEI
jgi:hypothetical protein